MIFRAAGILKFAKIEVNIGQREIQCPGAERTDEWIAVKRYKFDIAVCC